MTQSTAIRAEAVYVGKVQGVGFRATAHHLANEYHVSGWVRNEADGSVRLVAEGPREAVEAFLEALHMRMSGFITDQRVEWSCSLRGYSGFEIRY
ncbi:MAG: acylphosphatase [Planctomycetota bacterium]|nr:MAG: acylphosphatase [Planctomycetota bacterium]